MVMNLKIFSFIVKKVLLHIKLWSCQIKNWDYQTVAVISCKVYWSAIILLPGKLQSKLYVYSNSIIEKENIVEKKT